MLESIILAAGCFWCVEHDFNKLDGVVDVVSGYSGGDLMHPTYQNHHGHREVVEVTYKPGEVNVNALMEYYYRYTNWKDDKGAFCDRGFAYSPAIYYKTEEQKIAAQNAAPEGSLVPILPAKTFWEAEEYHQDYAAKNPLRYKYYRGSCGRDKVVAELNKEWRDSKFADQISKLNSLENNVILHEGTERPFTHKYAESSFYSSNPGIYVDVLSGQPLYATVDQYTSGTGWPSFHRAIEGGVLKYTPETFSNALELKSTGSYSHLGHIIYDNPHRQDRARHCINGVAIRHVALEDMVEQGYGDYVALIEAGKRGPESLAAGGIKYSPVNVIDSPDEFFTELEINIPVKEDKPWWNIWS